MDVPNLDIGAQAPDNGGLFGFIQTSYQLDQARAQLAQQQVRQTTVSKVRTHGYGRAI